jgi:hypothetical protein
MNWIGFIIFCIINDLAIIFIVRKFYLKKYEDYWKPYESFKKVRNRINKF